MLHILYSVLELEKNSVWRFRVSQDVNFSANFLCQPNCTVGMEHKMSSTNKYVPSSKSHCSWDISEGHSQKMCVLGTINFCKQNVLTEQI